MATCFKIIYGLIFALLSCFYFKGSDTQCSSGNHFGPNCDFKCHCLHKEQCNRSTGNCPTGCDFDWVGPGCQRNNIVPAGQKDEYEMVTRHQSNIPQSQFAALAVDRDLSTCSHTNYANKSRVVPWWRLWLKDKYKIRNISIVSSKESLDYFKNFEVLVENQPFHSRYGNNFTRQEICYKHGISSPTTTTFEVSCNKPIFGNQLRIRLATNGTQLVLCDVRIYGECSDGTFGVSCTENCSTHCIDICNKDFGTCASCSPGWTGIRCNQQVCDDGKYGAGCKFNCSGNCKNNALCRTTDGFCEDGCSPGYEGGKCDQWCMDGTYGQNCSYNCSGNCMNGSTCRPKNGYCSSGCKPGWTGDTCHDKCQDGFYGAHCTRNCSMHCLNGTLCLHTNGTCTNGCDPGWIGDTCKDVCQNGTYGAECVSVCSTHCLNGSVCLHTNGSCTNGCDPGWTGDTCIDECVPGSYGKYCGSNCSEHCANGSVCRITDGYCELGCKQGWTSATCDEKCPNGTYGANCTFNCSANCLNGSVCLHTNGSCLHGCASGWVGETCQQNYISEAGVTENVAASIITIIAVIVLLVSVFVVSYWKRKALVEKFSSFQAWCHRHQKCDENGFHNELYIDEHIGTEDISNVHTDQAMSTQNTDPVYTSTSLLDIQLHGVKAPNDVVYYNFIPTKRTPHAVSISELQTVMKKKCLIEGYFKSQFETIATGLLHPTTEAVKPRNIHKNRYKKMYPYDHSRVKLKELPGKPDSDYINASFIKGQGKDKTYIAAQGPVKENVTDFWRMIWEMDARTVVMVTNLAENGKMKCIQYWGTKDEVVRYGEIHVTMQSENVYAEFTIRDLMLLHQGDEVIKRNVTQFHFTAWPDKGVPKTSSSLLQFWRKVRQNDENKDHIWLVHCSAGVGRTGTFLATDILFDQGEKMGFVDVYKCVNDLREQRVNLVQTHEQYIYLHKLMLEVFSLPSKSINLDEFMTSYHQLQKKDNKSGKMKLWREYTSIESGVTWPTAVNDQQEGGKKEYTVDILADAFRPILSNYVPGSSNAIKATYVPSYFDLHEYIIAQWRPQFKMETCRLVFEKQIETVVTFPIDQRDDEIFFEESVSESDPFAVVCQSQIKKGDFIVKDHFLQSRNGKHYFKEIIFKCWSSESLVPEDPQAILDLVTEVDTQRHHSSAHGRKSILFQCWDGVDRSGLVAVIMNLLDRARVDNEVSIPQVIRQLRHNKKELITSFEQYKFCYDVMCCRLASNATYANV